MGYYASFGGDLTLCKLTEKDISDIRKVLTSVGITPYEDAETDIEKKYKDVLTQDIEVECGYDIEENEHNISISFNGYDKYRDDDWRAWLDTLFKYLDLSGVNSIEFEGEDRLKWRFVATDAGWQEEDGYVEYISDELNFIVCIDKSYIRDAQVQTDPEDDDSFFDINPNVFLEVVKTNSEEEAIRIVSEHTGYNKKLLYAFTVK